MILLLPATNLLIINGDVNAALNIGRLYGEELFKDVTIAQMVQRPVVVEIA